MLFPRPLYPFFFFNDTATTEIYTLSLHDALPIYTAKNTAPGIWDPLRGDRINISNGSPSSLRSEEHTSELQSHLNLVCRLLLEKKKEKQNSKKNNLIIMSCETSAID